MKKFISFIRKALLVIISILLIAVAFLYFTIGDEIINLKESSNSLSKGNCRIVNTIEASKRNLPIRIYDIYNPKGDKAIQHIIALDKDNTIVDKSRIAKGAVSLDGKTLDSFENRDKSRPILIYDGSNIVKQSMHVYLDLFYIKLLTYRYENFPITSDKDR